MDYSKITNRFVERKLTEILKELNLNYQDVKVIRSGDNFNIGVCKNQKKVPDFKIPIEYFEDEDRENELKTQLKQTLE